ncbi:MAG: 30S ribosomal protein S20 [Firmicutes bacterium]|nr:30S ribosomal protein S20 [Bacillota bacterium]NSW89322.1 30S ribosomal protein S20 [Bacillota bacterium]
MPNTKKAIKRVRIAEKKRLINAMRKSALRTAVKKCKIAIQNNDPKAAEFLKNAIKALDKAAAKNVIHKNTAARNKSKLTKAFNTANITVNTTVNK